MRTSTIKSVALLVTAGVSLVALGTASAADVDPDQVIAKTTAPPATTGPGGPGTTGAPVPTAPGVPTTSAATPTTIAGAPSTIGGTPSTIAGAATTIAGAPVTGLPPAATVAQFQAVVAPMLGTTTDLAGELNAVGVAPPAGIPTPDGSELFEFDVWYYPDLEDPVDSYYNATILFESSVPAADMVTLYQTQMIAAGFTQIGDSVDDEDGEQVRRLQYTPPNSTYENAEVTVFIVDADADYAQIDIYEALDAAVMQAFTSWPTGLPLIDQGTVEDAHISLNNFGGDVSMRLQTGWTLAIPRADVQAQLLAALASTPYTLDPDSPATESTVYLVGGEFDSLTVGMYEGYPEGTTLYNASAEVDLQL